MKKFLVMLASVAVLAVASLSVSSCSKTNGSLVGTKWLGVDDGEGSVLIDFNTETTCQFTTTDFYDGEVNSMTLGYTYEKPNVSIGGVFNGTVDKNTMVLYNPDGDPLTFTKQ
ncbi:MAG: hypothetical protein E7117_05935 [Bacteroidales bacterium]|nr:hypothetical protein [Bacteroidales bacterium]